MIEGEKPDGAGLKAEAWLQPRRFALLLAGLVILQFPDAALGFKSFFFRDYGFFGYPLAAYHRDTFWNGEIPLWNPYNDAGLPFLAQWNTMVLYPGSLIYLLLPVPWSVGIFCLAHQFCAGLGMYFLGRRSAQSNLAGAVAGLAFAFSGLLLSSLKWPNNIAAFGLMPWVVLVCLHWRSIGLAALLGGLQMLTGAPEAIFLTWVIVGVATAGEAIAQRRLGPIFRLGLIVILVTGMAAAQLLPFLDLLSQSQRSARFSDSEWPMPIWGWANFFVPLFGTFPSYHGVPAQPEQYWTSTYYLPLAALALASLSVLNGGRARLLAGLAIFGAVMALGDPGFVYKAFRKSFPFLGFMRFPIKFVVLPVFIIPWLAAYGWLVAREKKNRLIAVAILFVAIAGVLAFVPSPFKPTQTHSAILMNAGSRIFFLGVFAAVFMFREKKIALASAVLLAAVWADGRFHAPDQNPRAPAWVFDRGLPVITNAPTLGAGRALLEPAANAKLDHLLFDTPEADISASRLALYANANLIDHIPKIDGFYSLYLREASQLIDFLYSKTNQSYPPFERFLAVSHRTAPGKTAEWRQLVENPPWITGGQREVLANPADTVRGLLSPEFDSTKIVYLPLTNQNQSAIGPADVRISEVSWRPEKISFRAKASAASRVVLSQAFHPNWRATVSGKPVRIDRANYGFQAIQIPAGESQLELKYVDGKFRMGAVISLVSCGIIAALILGGIRHPQKLQFKEP